MYILKYFLVNIGAQVSSTVYDGHLRSLMFDLHRGLAVMLNNTEVQ
jgi:hypothetical protein